MIYRYLFTTVWTVLLTALFTASSFATEQNSSDQLIIINKTTNQLAFYQDGALVDTFPVGTGRETTYTPEGTFTIVNKIKNRPYYTKNIKGGDPNNPLGDRWMGLDARGTRGDTYGIHGNNNENSIGKYVSAGCVRMHNKDIRWLFEQVKVNTPVYITRSKLSFDQLALDHGYALGLPEPEKVDVTLTMFSTTQLFSKPSKAFPAGAALGPQAIKAFEKADDWYHVKTWFGDAWLKTEEMIVGEIKPVDLEIGLTEEAILHTLPLSSTSTGGAVSPQTVKAFEEWNGWYHIKSWMGDRWIKVGEKGSLVNNYTYNP